MGDDGKKIGKVQTHIKLFHGQIFCTFFEPIQRYHNKGYLNQRVSKQSNRPFNNIVIKKIFVALIGPSLSAKTQSTYAMEDRRAL